MTIKDMIELSLAGALIFFILFLIYLNKNSQSISDKCPYKGHEYGILKGETRARLDTIPNQTTIIYDGAVIYGEAKTTTLMMIIPVLNDTTTTLTEYFVFAGLSIEKMKYYQKNLKNTGHYPYIKTIDVHFEWKGTVEDMTFDEFINKYGRYMPMICTKDKKEM
jgi:hypothetical protein